MRALRADTLRMRTLAPYMRKGARVALQRYPATASLRFRTLSPATLRMPPTYAGPLLGLARPRRARYKAFMAKDPIKPKPGTIYISKFYGWPRAVRIESVAPPPRGGWLATALPSGKACRIQYAKQLLCEAEPDWRAHVARLEAEHRAAKGLPGAEAPAGTPRYDVLRETISDLEERIDALEERIEGRLARLEQGGTGGES